MPQKTFMDVFNESLRDDVFREDLLKDHRAALKSKDWELDAANLTQLDDFMAGDQIADPATILEAFSAVFSGTSPKPPPPWRLTQPIEEST